MNTHSIAILLPFRLWHQITHHDSIYSVKEHFYIAVLLPRSIMDNQDTMNFFHVEDVQTPSPVPVQMLHRQPYAHPYPFSTPDIVLFHLPKIADRLLYNCKFVLQFPYTKTFSPAHHSHYFEY